MTIAGVIDNAEPDSKPLHKRLAAGQISSEDFIE
jgi:hypothetical protein